MIDMKLKDILLKLKEKSFRIDFHETFEKLQSNGKLLLLTVIATFAVMSLACLAVFTVNVKGPEQVLVPDVTGKKLTAALIEMQAKKLYPEIQLRYSETPGDEGTVLEQNPSGGAIRKGFSHISLVVSRGVVIDHVENYIGENIDAVRMKLQTLFAGTARPLIVIAPPQYKADTAEAGTILAQNPPKGTNITEPVTVYFVVSRGPNFENTRVPDMRGNSVNDVLRLMSRTRLVFDFTSHEAAPGETAGTVVREQTFAEELVPNYTHVAVEFAFPRQAQAGNVYGIFQDVLPVYPYAVQLKLAAKAEDADAYTVVTFSHPGGNVTIPYAVSKGTELALSVVSSDGEKEHKRIVVR